MTTLYVVCGRCVRRGKVESPLFDTAGWVRDQERGLRMASEVAMARVHEGETVVNRLNLVVSRKE